jgi:hypothetical protein
LNEAAGKATKPCAMGIAGKPHFSGGGFALCKSNDFWIGSQLFCVITDKKNRKREFLVVLWS